jgi:HAD superfamily hydrolase (TIGR01490 family)
MPARLAFYDLDGTLVSSNVVTQYAFYVRNHPRRITGALKFIKLLASVPVLFSLDLYSRRLFNEVFYREYRGMNHDWLRDLAGGLFERVIRPAIYPGAEALVAADRARGYETVLVTGSLDFCLAPVVGHFRFDHVICNSMEFSNGAATGRIAPPLIAEREKVAALRRLIKARRADASLSKAYSDSMSDVPMLESVGLPSAVNPGRRLRRVAQERGWPILDLKRCPYS